jgi:hypothetical protein
LTALVTVPCAPGFTTPSDTFATLELLLAQKRWPSRRMATPIAVSFSVSPRYSVYFPTGEENASGSVGHPSAGAVHRIRNQHL